MTEARGKETNDNAPRKYGAHQNEIYRKGMMQNIRPTITADPNKLEAQAKEEMRATAYAYVAGGAGERATMDANRLAFRQWKLIPRMLQPTTHRDLRVTLFGEEYATPILVAPVGVQSIFHPDGEVGVAEVAGELGVPFVCSTASSFTMEEIAKANASKSAGAQRWFQLYWPQSNDITVSLLSRAKAAGFSTLVVTVDTWALAWRPWDLDRAYIPFFKGTGNATGFSDPVFRGRYEAESGRTIESDEVAASAAWIADVFSGAAHSWEELALLRENWDGPILLKGIQHAADARRAIAECGLDGVVVSNHGGRQLDGAVGSLEMLPEIADALRPLRTRAGKSPEVIFDSGVRTGVDIIKALCLGAKAVLVGRPWVYGLGIAGKEGVRDVLKGILADLDQSMGLAGIRSTGDCDRGRLRRTEYGGDRFSSY